MLESIPSYTPKKRGLIKKGFNALNERRYLSAMKLFSEALSLDTSDLEAKVGVLIADIATDFPKKAEVFNELYHILLSTAPRANRADLQRQMLDLLSSFDEGLNEISQTMQTEDNLESESLDGVAYKDFQKMCEIKGFKEVFENLIFSTKVIFTSREDFYTFLKDLIENGFENIALSYIEDMPQITRNKDILQIIQNKNALSKELSNQTKKQKN
ncbi:histidine kinase [Helicobacter sp. T3_23-1056]